MDETNFGYRIPLPRKLRRAIEALRASEVRHQTEQEALRKGIPVISAKRRPNS